MCEVNGRLIAVTGASGNLGAATAGLLLEHGAHLILLDRDTRSHESLFTAALERSGATSPNLLKNDQR